MSGQVHQLVQQIHGMSRTQCIDALTHFDGIPLDFTEPFLQRMSVERLRHILLAAMITVDRRRSA
ncbi:hypothetical protein HED60_18810 [Planctomycetales bacterium ZRK34]|nr:hypothetical protein HED60_18810 [Planctomycetales bacterium ZRK34]